MEKNQPEQKPDSDPRVVELMRTYKNGGINLEDAVRRMQILTGLSPVVCEVFLSAIRRKNVVDLKNAPRNK